MSCNGCTAVIQCDNTDLAPSVGYEATQPYSILVTCPAGYYCAPGTFPKIIVIDPGTIPTVTIGQGSQVCIQGCLSLICMDLPANASAAKKQQVANALFLEFAQQQAICNAKVNLPVIPQELPHGCLNSNYQQLLQAAGTGSIRARLLVGPLPPGMRLSGAPSGIYLTGQPTIAGTYSFSIQFVSPLSSSTVNYSLSVLQITVSPPGADATHLADATSGSAYTATFQAPPTAKTPLSWQVIGTLPAGLNLNETTGVLSGTPTTPGNYTFDILLQEQAT